MVHGKALFIYTKKPPQIKEKRKTKKFKEEKLKYPQWCTQIRLDLSNEGIKNPKGS